jgi:hypothetical protein
MHCFEFIDYDYGNGVVSHKSRHRLRRNRQKETAVVEQCSSDRFDLLTPSNPVGACGALADAGMTRQDCRIYTGPKLRSGPSLTRVTPPSAPEYVVRDYWQAVAIATSGRTFDGSPVLRAPGKTRTPFSASRQGRLKFPLPSFKRPCRDANVCGDPQTRP